MRLIPLAIAAVVLAGCGDSNPDRIPLKVMAVQSVDDDGTTREARAFAVLEPVVIDTGILAAEGTFHFSARFDSDRHETGIIVVRVRDRAIQSCAIEAGAGWKNFAVPLAEDLPAESIDLAVDVPGRYSLASLELAASDGSGGG